MGIYIYIYFFFQKRREKIRENRKSSKKASDGPKPGQKRKLGNKKVEQPNKRPRSDDSSKRDQLKVTFSRGNEKPRKVISSKAIKQKKPSRGGKNDAKKSPTKEDFQQRTQGSQRKAPKSPEKMATRTPSQEDIAIEKLRKLEIISKDPELKQKMNEMFSEMMLSAMRNITLEDKN